MLDVWDDIETAMAKHGCGIVRRSNSGTKPVDPAKMSDVLMGIEADLAKLGCGIVSRPPPAPEPIKRDWIRIPVSKEVSHNRLADIAQVVSDITRIPMKEIMGRRRAAPICRARHLCFYLARVSTDYSFPRIAKFFGNRDHTTIVHSGDKVAGNPQAFEPELSQALKLLGVPADIAA